MGIALSETFHIGMAVEDIDQCCKQIGEDLNLDWLPIKSFFSWSLLLMTDDLIAQL